MDRCLLSYAAMNHLKPQLVIPARLNVRSIRGLRPYPEASLQFSIGAPLIDPGEVGERPTKYEKASVYLTLIDAKQLSQNADAYNRGSNSVYIRIDRASLVQLRDNCAAILTYLDELETAGIITPEEV